MTTYVTVNTSATSSVLVPFTSAANAVIAQAALDATDNKFIKLAPELVTYFTPSATLVGSSSGPASVTVPATTYFGAVANTSNANLNFGAFDPLYHNMVNGAVDSVGAAQGAGTAYLVGSYTTSVWSGANAQMVYLNAGTNAKVFLGGNSTNGDAISNFDAASKVNVWTGNDQPSVYAIATMNDTVGGGATVHTAGNAIVRFLSGGSDMVIADGGNAVVEADSTAGGAAGILTVRAASAGTNLTVQLGGAPVFITPGPGNVVVTQLDPNNEQTATLFGGTRTIGGHTVTAAAFTGSAQVLSGRGYFEGGSAGHNVLQTSKTAGTATMVAGGSNDTILIQAAGDYAYLGNGTNVIAAVTSIVSGTQSVGGVAYHGDHFILGNGTGSAFGAAGGYNDFVIAGSGNYTLIGSHDTTTPNSAVGALHGSVYHEASTAGGGTITILDFLPQQITGGVAGALFDQFDLGSASLVGSITSTVVSVLGAGLTLYDDTAHLSDGTTIIFKNTLNTVHQVGTSIV